MFAQRLRRPELMDQPGLAPLPHRRALAGLARINAWSRGANLVWQPMHDLIRSTARRRLSLLDVGCGGGDVPLDCQRLAGSHGVQLEVTALDRSPTALACAAERAAARGISLRCLHVDVVTTDLPGRFDVVTCTLLLHHLERADAVRLLAKMAAAARCLLVVQDLQRSAAGYAVAWLGTRLLTRSSIVHRDGPASVVAAFTPMEAEALAREAGLADAHVAQCFPWRWVLVWRGTEGP